MAPDMLRRYNKRKAEGWALDIDEFENGHGLRERLAASNRLWIFCFLVIICLAVAFIVRTIGTSPEIPPRELIEKPRGVYTDSEHRQLIKDLMDIAAKRGVNIADARFVSNRNLMIVMPGDVGGDDIAFLSRTAAVQIWQRFGVGAIIKTYTEDITNSTTKLAAITQWNRRKNNFVTTFQSSLVSE